MFALLFPGQGSQRPGMGEAWHDHPSWHLVTTLSEAVGRDLAWLLLGASAEELQATRNAQLASYTLGLVALDALRTSGSWPGLQAGLVATAGHSLGEYCALVAAGALTPAEGAQLVLARGEAMQAASELHPGTMAAVLGPELGQVAKACQQAEGVWVANDNAPGQVVIAGRHDGVERAGAAALELGAKRVVPLKVGGAFHTPLMRSAQGPLDAALAGASFSAPRFPVVANVDAQAHRDGFGPLLSAQLCSQVRWRESLLTLAAMGTRLFVELGPGTELSGMVKRTVPQALRANIAKPDDLGTLAKQLSGLEAG